MCVNCIGDPYCTCACNFSASKQHCDKCGHDWTGGFAVPGKQRKPSARSHNAAKPKNR